MTSWVRPTAAVIAGRPVVLVALIVTVCTWCAAAEIYWVALQGPHHGESAAAVLVGVDVLYSWLLVAGFLALVKDLKELRIPQLRSLLIISLLAVFVMVFLAPCVAVWLLGGPAGDVVFMAMGSVVGTAGPAVCQSGYRVRNARVAARNAGPARLMTDSVRAPRPQAWRAVRVAFGAPYAPQSWTRRVIELALWCAVLAAAPLLVWSFESSLNPRGFRILLHVAELVSIVIAIASCWLWPLARVVTLVTSQSGTLTELALLPGQGSGRQQLRRLCLVALSIPSAALIVVLGLALGVVKLEHLPQAMYARVAAGIPVDSSAYASGIGRSAHQAAWAQRLGGGDGHVFSDLDVVIDFLDHHPGNLAWRATHILLGGHRDHCRRPDVPDRHDDQRAAETPAAAASLYGCFLTGRPPGRFEECPLSPHNRPMR